MKKYICYILYCLFAKYLPVTYHIGGNIGRFFRYQTAKGFLEFCGKNVTIEKGARFGRRVHLGHNSGIGINALIDGECYIG